VGAPQGRRFFLIQSFVSGCLDSYILDSEWRQSSSDALNQAQRSV
jgi:hypothetical protein